MSAGNGKRNDTLAKSLEEAPLPPHSLEAEQACLGAALISEKAAKQIVAALETGDFYSSTHGTIYSIIAELVKQEAPVDAFTVPDRLRQKGLLEKAGGLAYFSQLTDSVPTAAHSDYYSERVRKYAIRRRLIEDANAAIAAAHEDDDPDAAVALAATRLDARRREAMQGKDLPKPVSLTELFTRKYTPRKALVKRMWVQGLTMLHSGPKVGKTKLISNLVVAAGTGGKFLGTFDCERSGALCLFMEDTELDTQERFLAHLQGQDIPDDIFIEWSWPDLASGGLELIDEFLTAHPTVKLVIVDTLEMLLAERDPRADIYRHDAYTVRSLKNLSDKHEAHLVVLHHSNKSKELQEDIIASAGGTHGKTGSCDCVAQLVPQADETIVFRGKGRRMPPFGHVYRIVDGADESYDLEYIGDAAEVGSSDAQGELLEVLAGGAMSASELRQELGIQPSAFRMRTKRAVARGLIRHVGRGSRTLWELTLEGQAALAAIQAGVGTPGTPGTPATPASYRDAGTPGTFSGNGSLPHTDAGVSDDESVSTVPGVPDHETLPFSEDFSLEASPLAVPVTGVTPVTADTPVPYRDPVTGVTISGDSGVPLGTRGGVTGVTKRTSDTSVTPVTGVTPAEGVFREPLSLPIGTDPDAAALRQATWSLACARGFPRLSSPMSTTGGEDWYRTLCLDAVLRDVQAVLRTLEGLP